MTKDADSLRRELGELDARLARGDLRPRDVEKLRAEKSVELFRLAARGQLDEGEPILAEHHLVHAHLKLAESVLREPDQEAESLFATDRRLVRVSALWPRGRPPVRGTEDDLRVDAVRYERIDALAPGREYRTSEIAAGAVIVVVALAFRTLLLVTGTILVLVGALGMLHGLLFPVRWLEVRARGGDAERALRIHGLWRKSARALLLVVRARIARAEVARDDDETGTGDAASAASSADGGPDRKA